MGDGLDTLSEHLRGILDRMPAEPGVYLMKDKKGKIVYVGKASSLRARVRSYFTRSGDTRDFVPLLGRLLGDIETVVTNNEKEALLLENNLIKQHQPRFNVKLVDDKNYLVLKLDPTARYPRLEVVRRIGGTHPSKIGDAEETAELRSKMKHDPAKYFGPYHSATSCRATLKVVNRHFKLRTCTDHVLDSRTRPCLQYQIKRCDAPCVYPVPAEEYAEQVRDVALFLDGKDQELIARLRDRMKAAASQLEFERAAAVRDQIGALEKTLEEQRVVSTDLRDQDVIGFHRAGATVEIAVMHIRQGKLLGRQTFSFTDQEFPDEETLSSFVGLYYDQGSYIPDEVLLHCSIEDAHVKAEWLRERRGGRKVEVLVPKRGDRARLVELAMKNAAASYHSRRDKGKDAEEALAKLKQRLSLKRDARRIECFDISHIQGTDTVASMVVFLDGEPAKAEYRHFKVRLAQNDDFASMYEVLSRRFRRSVKGAPGPHGEDAGDGEAKRWPLPDLLVIDGGKGQLATAMAALRDVGVDTGASGIDVIGLAKEREDVQGDKKPDRVFRPHLKDPIQLRANTAELFVLSRIRDEAHRFAVTFHKQQRRKRTLRSALADVPGVGPKRQRELLRHFGSLKGVRTATVDELAAVQGMSRAAAEAVRAFLDAQAGAIVPTTDASEVAPATVDLALQQDDGATQQIDAAPQQNKKRKPRRKKLDDTAVAEDAAGEELAKLVEEGLAPADEDVPAPADEDLPA